MSTRLCKVPSLSSKLETSLAAKFPEGEYTNEKGDKYQLVCLQVDSVGPKVGAELRQQDDCDFSDIALILVYVALRFNLSFAHGAVLALFHDVSIVVGVFVTLDILGITYEFNLQ